MNQRPDGTYYITVFNTRIGRFKTKAKALEARAWVNKTRYRTLKALSIKDRSELIENYINALRARYPDKRARKPKGLALINGKPHIQIQRFGTRYTLGPLKSLDDVQPTYEAARQVLDNWDASIDPTRAELESLTIALLKQQGLPVWK